MYAEAPWVLVSSETQVQSQVILDPDYLPDYLSGSHVYGFINLFIFLNTLKKSRCRFAYLFVSFPKSFFLFFFRGFNIIVIIMSIFFIVFPFLLNFVLFSTLFNHHLLLTDVLYLLKNNFLDLHVSFISNTTFQLRHSVACPQNQSECHRNSFEIIFVIAMQ